MFLAVVYSHFWRSVYGASAAGMLQDFISNGLHDSKLKGAVKGANKYQG